MTRKERRPDGGRGGTNVTSRAISFRGIWREFCGNGRGARAVLQTHPIKVFRPVAT